MSVAIVILAAGQSSRMGSAHKLLAEFDGMPLIHRSVVVASSCQSHSVIAVTGYRYAEIGAAITDLPVKLVYNAEFSSGMASSLVLGVAAAEADQPDGIMIMLADMPAVTVSDLDALIAAFSCCEARSIVRAAAGDRPGNPVIFPRALYADLKKLTGDKGARELIRSSGFPVADIEIGDGAIIDVDTPDAIEAAGGVLRG
ncbi:nucleotidyltransferase family protein [Agrobacterium leguminum]|uniref:nucleotidyltransferase family protein n=1 Tax=Agrobacterium leguminum TaxID=2792015 RepID=UPI001F1F2532|nr:nucleotidyltransferase family protein [Agrobacterium leguminum]